MSKDTVTSNIFISGQRWSSNSEPELGLGIIESVDQQFVNILFPACDELRQYSTDSPPLYRMRFQAGATIQDVNGQEHQVEQVSEKGGLITYHCGKTQIPELKLGANMADRGPEERLADGQATESSFFDLRLRSLRAMFEWRRSPVRGLFGGKMDLIPHQLYIAHEVSNRQSPRVLLADEVGLGKTIEACLILNRLLTCGRANRVLILVPGSLVHQWFVELLRRFNHWFNIFDEERCLSIESGQECTNPFEDDQLILADIDWLSQSPKRVNQVIDTDWDLLIIDEAHHLKWDPEEPSEKYKLVDQIGQKAHALLLLTATPEQVGLENHFARLRLLDHSRFSNFEAFKSETEKYKPVAVLCQKLINNEPLNNSELDRFPVTESTLAIAKSEIAKNKKLSIVTKDKFIRELADRHGTGRVLFRNTRKTITGFPKRFAKIYSIKNTTNTHTLSMDEEEFNYDINLDDSEPNYDFSNDPRIDWLTKLLKDNESEKFLLICRTQPKTAAIENSLRDRINIKTAVFHEELSLVQRDRNAAWFADTEGARLLICSEIGSEGRNFQFCHHLILFDLPINPELIEQRIGRLDRIGQINDILIHIPTIENSQRERLAKWQHYGLNAFEENIPGGQTLITQYRDQLLNSLKDKCNDLDTLIQETKKSR
ncbi:MAG: RNA polymerase-associated protein RapA, partial [Verrucomicrobiota bacterium]|nr:RNA polymerase-associated protein RapA [Verrucomicrobiota bacterium]